MSTFTPYLRTRWFLLGAIAGLALAVALAFVAPSPSPRTGTTAVQPRRCTSDIPPPIWIAPPKPDIQL